MESLKRKTTTLCCSEWATAPNGKEYHDRCYSKRSDERTGEKVSQTEAGGRRNKGNGRYEVTISKEAVLYDGWERKLRNSRSMNKIKFLAGVITGIILVQVILHPDRVEALLGVLK